MKLPKNYSEAQVLEIFDKVAKNLSFKFKFGVNSQADIYQQAMVYAIEGLQRYDETRPLENFLFVHVRNRLYNYKRNNYFRLAKPCEQCPLSAFLPPDGCSAFSDRTECELYRGWLDRNTVRKNLTNVLEYNQINVSEKNLGYSDNLAGAVNTKEILELIDDKLPIPLRKSYLKQLSGERIPKKEKLILEEEIIKILKNHGYEL
jgi:hypothetical protein